MCVFAYGFPGPPGHEGTAGIRNPRCSDECCRDLVYLSQWPKACQNCGLGLVHRGRRSPEATLWQLWCDSCDRPKPDWGI